ncbi:MAG: MBL fold metallo-hydrolase [Acidilobus sp.]
MKRFSTWIEPLDRPANGYLVKHEGYLLVIDGGVQEPPAEALKAPYALLTHWHWDHVLGLARGKYRGVICASSYTVQYLQGSLPTFEGSSAIMKAFGEVPDAIRPLLEASLSRVYEIINYVRSGVRLTTLDDCEPVQVGVVKVIDCPGHSDDHVCYKVGEHAFVGDSVNPDAGLSILSLEEYLRSLLRLLSDPTWTVAHPGHGRDVDRAYVAGWAAETLSGKIKRVTTLRSLLSRDWKPLVSYLDVLYGPKDPLAKWIGARSLLGYALSLARMGLAELNTDSKPWSIRAREERCRASS